MFIDKLRFFVEWWKGTLQRIKDNKIVIQRKLIKCICVVSNKKPWINKWYFHFNKNNKKGDANGETVEGRPYAYSNGTCYQ